MGNALIWFLGTFGFERGERWNWLRWCAVGMVVLVVRGGNGWVGHACWKWLGWCTMEMGRAVGIVRLAAQGAAQEHV